MSAGSSRRLMRSPTSFGSTAAIAHSSRITLCPLPWHRLGLASGMSRGNAQAHSLVVCVLAYASYYTPGECTRPTVFRLAAFDTLASAILQCSLNKNAQPERGNRVFPTQQAITGVILAGGQSSRMGQNKALMSLGGKRLVDHVVAV